jgi:Flp pilus assembly pilin Flp
LERGQPNVQVDEEFCPRRIGRHRIEYALIASLIAVFVITALQTMGTKIRAVFTEVSNALK